MLGESGFYGSCVGPPLWSGAEDGDVEWGKGITGISGCVGVLGAVDKKIIDTRDGHSWGAQIGHGDAVDQCLRAQGGAVKK